MAKHTQTIRWRITEHFVGLALKGLIHYIQISFLFFSHFSIISMWQV